MATNKPTRPSLPGQSISEVQIYKWVLGPGDVGSAVAIPRSSDRSLQVYGDFDGATAVFEGANDPDDPSYMTMNDSRGEGNPLTFTTADIRQVGEVATLVRPNHSGGNGSESITFVLTSVRR